jgi:hypothetical protein
MLDLWQQLLWTGGDELIKLILIANCTSLAANKNSGL